MQFAQCLCVFLITAVLVSSIDARSRKTFSTRRKSGGNRRGQTNTQHRLPPPQPQPATPHRTDSSTSFLNSERAGSSHSTSVNTHHRGDPFKNNQQTPKQTVPQTNGPIGFEGLNNQGNKQLGFDKVNSEVQRKPAVSNPSAPAYPAGSPPYPGGKPASGPPNGPPPAYNPGYGSPSGTHGGGFDPPPAYPGRPVNAPPVYSANNPSFGQTNANQPGYGAYPRQQGSFPGQSYPGQQNFGHPNTGGNFGNYPHQSSYPSGGYGQSYPGGFGGNPYGGSPFGGSPFGQSNSYGGFGSPGFGGNSFGGNHYSPNNFGYSNNPGFFGGHSSHPGQFSNYGYHKKSRFGGLPIPIPIPIPIPMGLFGGGLFGGGHRSRNHHELDTFIQNKTVNTADNTTTAVYILNNATVTPCTTDQFIYDSLNITVLSCTAGNCTAVKIFVTTYLSKETNEYSAGLTMCMEPNTTYNMFSNNVNPTVSDIHRYWMQVCREIVSANITGNVTESPVSNFTVKVSEVVLNETVISADNTTANASEVVESTSVSPTTDQPTSSPPNVTDQTVPTVGNSSAPTNTSGAIDSPNSTNSSCEIFDCSWIELCLPSIDVVDRCVTPGCPFTKTGYRPCIKIKMCKSPSTPISTFATLNNTLTRTDQYNATTSVNDVANLTLVSYIPPTVPFNCSQDATDPACQQPPILSPEGCVSANSTETSKVDGVPLCNPNTTESAAREKRSTKQTRSVIFRDGELFELEI